jgi:hypothetical protein
MCPTVVTLLEHVRQALHPVGLNLVGVTTVETYDRRVPPPLRMQSRQPTARVLLVVGNGGPQLWTAFARSGWHRRVCHEPLDSFTQHCIEQRLGPILNRAGATWRAFYPHRFGAEPLSFQDLAHAAGLGVPSLLGLMIHPTYGPWIALRCAVALDLGLPVSTPLSWTPCAACPERPCISACPGSAVTAEAGWSAVVCSRQRLHAPDSCADGCHARHACIYGQPYRYPPAAQRHHQAASLAEMQRYAQ